MKKTALTFLFAMSLISVTLFAQTGTSKVQIGNKITTIKSIIKDGYTHVGVRELGDALGIIVGYLGDTHTAILAVPGTEMEIHLATGETFVNNAFVGNASVVIADGFSYLPFRFICENLGYMVGYEDGIIKLPNAQDVGFITPESDKIFDPNGSVYEETLNSNDKGSIPKVEAPDTSAKPTTPTADEHGFTPADYYIEYLTHIDFIRADLFELCGSGLEAWPSEVILAQKAYLDGTIMPKLVGTEFEPLVKDWEGIVDLAVTVYKNNGRDNESLLEAIADAHTVLNDEMARLGTSEVIRQKIENNLNSILGY